VLAFIDLATRRLPDTITLPALPVLFLAAFGAHDVPWLERLIGAAAGYLVFRLIADGYYHYHRGTREGLGLGDGKLLALIGAVLGWRALPFVVFVGSIAGIVVMLPVAIASRRSAPDPETEEEGEPGSLRHLQIPFGPFLAAAALIYVFAGAALYRYLLQV
jgi:leader peptidase (prepilin peptidase)/N-methyltransferase